MHFRSPRPRHVACLGKQALECREKNQVRKFLIVIGGLLAVLLGGVLSIVWLVDPDNYREELGARASAMLGREVQLQGPISLRLWPSIALNIEDVEVANPPGFEAAPALARIGQAAVAVRLWPLLRGELDIGTVALSNAHLAMVTDRRGGSNLEGLLADEDAYVEEYAPPDLSRLSLGRLKLSEVVLEQLDLSSGQRTLLQLDSLELDPFRAGQAVPVSLRGSVSDGQTILLDSVELDGRLQVAADLGRIALEDWRLGLRLPQANTRVQAEGALEAEFDGAAPLVHVQRLNAQVDANGQDVRFELRQPLQLALDHGPAGELGAARLSLNGQDLDLAGAFVLGDPFSADLRVAGQSLDLRPLLDSGTAPSTAGTEPAGGQGDFSFLVGPRLVLALNLDELILSEDLRLSALSAQARLRDGRLQLEPLQARLFGGDFAGSAAVDFTVSPPSTRINPRFTGIQAQQVLGLLSDSVPLRGLGELNLDFNFSGLSLGEILASLDGRGSFRLDEGALLGVDLRRLIDERLTVSTLANVNEVFGGETPFRSLQSSIRAESGVVFLPDLNLNAADFGAAGQGQLDFAAGQLAYRLELQLGAALRDRLPRQLARATEGVIPLAISGPLSRPLVQVDLAAMAEGAIQRELQDRLQDRLLERLRPSEPPAEVPSEGESEPATTPRRPDRASDLLMRSLRERQEREREEPPPETR